MKNINLPIPRPEHPEPMMYREKWENLNGEWLFELDEGISGEARGMHKCNAENMYSQKIIVPFCPESVLSGIGNVDFKRSVWYKRSFDIDDNKFSGKILLHFGAVDYKCTVYINGKKVGEHFGGYSSFAFDITEFVVLGKNDVTVNAFDDARNGRQPRGKQSDRYESYGCLYTRTTGIWQTVWLEFVPKSYIKSLRYYPDINDCSFDIEVNALGEGKLKVEALYNGKTVGVVERNISKPTTLINLPLSEKHLWEVGKGRLYDLKFTYLSSDGEDVLESYAGLREVKLDGFKFLLNGKSVFQRTVLDQGFYPDGIYTAPTDEALKQDIELSMGIGFNGARLHEKIFEPRFLYHADKMGYLVWGEHANWGIDILSSSAVADFLPEWSEALSRDFNHPSIIGWCPFNETWAGFTDEYERTIRAIYEFTKKFDTTRPVIDTSGGYHVISDIYDQHHYDQNPETFRNKYVNYDGSVESFTWNFSDKQKYIPNLPFYMSEFGGIKWIRECDKTPDDNSWGYGNTPKTEKEFFERYDGLVTAIVDSPNIMGFCYTQLYDIEQEKNGLYCYDRTPKFDDYSKIFAANQKKAAIED